MTSERPINQEFTQGAYETDAKEKQVLTKESELRNSINKKYLRCKGMNCQKYLT